MMPTPTRSSLAIKLTLAALFLALTIAPSLYADQAVPAKRGDTTTIALIADPQFFVPQEKRATTIPYEEIADQGLRCVERLDPDCVVAAGDLVHHRGDQSEIETFWKWFGALDPKIPLHCVPGNHDIKHTVESIEKYKKRFGKDYYTFQIGQDRFLVLNSVLLRVSNMRAENAAKHWEWVENELKKAQADKVRHTVVFMHHPLFVLTPHEPNEKNFRIKNRVRLFELFEKYGVDAVFSGHFHFNTVNKHHGVEYVATNSFCAPVLFHDPAGFRLIELGPEGVTHRYIKQPDYSKEGKQETPVCVPAGVSK